MRAELRGAARFFIGLELALYPQNRLYQEMAFLGYYMHWPREELMNLDHRERRRWCGEISAINKTLSGNKKGSFEFK